MALLLVCREGQGLQVQLQDAAKQTAAELGGSAVELERQRARVRQLEAYVGARAQVGQSWRGASLISFRMSAS